MERRPDRGTLRAGIRSGAIRCRGGLISMERPCPIHGPFGQDPGPPRGTDTTLPLRHRLPGRSPDGSFHMECQTRKPAVVVDGVCHVPGRGDICERCYARLDGSRPAGWRHNHPKDVDGIRIGIVGCPGCMAEEDALSEPEGSGPDSGSKQGVELVEQNQEKPAGASMLADWLHRIGGPKVPWIDR